ncbi:hypothetical protein ANN_17048 [Periplaneta americana]|uniref:Uncharacterized protein n=1 Tax=Periplaneta americana TaxID=6978 RepID=A0ABQ8SRU4_PERAM|nr:hypothetical protein ANN_17048 [Periplaneta americana]
MEFPSPLPLNKRLRMWIQQDGATAHYALSSPVNEMFGVHWDGRSGPQSCSPRSPCAPLYQIKAKFLNDLDKVTRGACKDLIGLPHDCPDGMLYSPKKYRGLSLMKASWEASVQHINICNTLLRVDDSHLHNVRDLVSEKVSALSNLNITAIDAINWSGRKIRKHLRNDAFQTWTNHTLRGKEVIVYSYLPKANSWVSLSATHRVGVDLTHVPASVSLVHVLDVQIPRAVVVIRQGNTGILCDHIVVYRQNSLRVDTNPGHLPTVEDSSLKMEPDTDHDDVDNDDFTYYSIKVPEILVIQLVLTARFDSYQNAWDKVTTKEETWGAECFANKGSRIVEVARVSGYVVERYRTRLMGVRGGWGMCIRELVAEESWQGAVGTANGYKGN